MVVKWDIANSYAVTLSNNDLTASYSGRSTNKIRATKGITSGKWYWEVSFKNSSAFYIGIIAKSIVLNEYADGFIDIPKTRGYYPYSGLKYPEKTSYGITDKINADVTIGVFLDLDNGTLEFFRDKVSMGVSHSNLKTIGEELYPFISAGSAGSVTATAIFGDSDFYFIPNTLPSDTKKYNGNSLYSSYKILLLQENGEVNSINSANSTITKISSHSEQNFIKYGMDSPVKVDGIFSNKNYILQDKVSEDTDGLWKQELNRKPLSIKFE